MTGVQTCALPISTTGILQGLGKAHLPVFSIFAGALVKLVLSYILTAIPALNIRGAATATVVAFVVSSGLNLLALHSGGKVRIDWGSVFLRPALAAAGMGIAVVYSRDVVSRLLVSPNLATLVSLGIGGISYALLAVVVGSIKISELQGLPVVGRLLGKVFFR